MRMEVWEKDLDRWLTTPPEPMSHPCTICGFDVYDNEELCVDCLEDQQQEESKEEMNMSAVEMIKNELCSRYGINPEQITVSVSIDDVESVELADQIKKDYTVEGKVLDFMRSCKGYNQHIQDINFHSYLVAADHGTHAKKENIINLDVRTKNGVLKHEPF
jgi:hypothetical protein